MNIYSLEFQNVVPLHHSIHCRRCGNQVACVQDYIRLWPRGIFNRVFNVVVLENVKYHRRILGIAAAIANCVQCGVMLGWKFITVTPKNSLIKEGKFLMKLHMLCLWNDVPLLRLKKVHDLCANEEKEQTVDQDGDTNEKTDDQDGGANEQVPNEQDLGSNEQNVNQDEDTDEEDVGAIQNDVHNFLTRFICQNAYQGGGGNELNHEQDVGTNEKNTDQDRDAKEEVPNEHDLRMLLNKMEIKLNKMKGQLIKMETLLIKMKITNQDGDATDQDGDTNEQNADQDGDATDQDGDTNEQNADQDGDTTDQDGDTNEQNADQDGDATEEVPNEQDLGTLLIKMEIELLEMMGQLFKMETLLIKMDMKLIKMEALQ